LRLQPPLEVPHPNLMLNPGLPDQNRDSRQTSTDIIDPIVLTKRSQALSYSLIKRIRRHLGRMLDPLQVAERHCASPKAHGDSS